MYPPPLPANGHANHFDRDTLHITDAQIPARPVQTATRRQRDRRFFLIYEEQFCRACVLPGKALAVYLVLLRRARREETVRVKLTSTALVGFGITRRQKDNALRALEEARLIVVERQHGKNPAVTLVDVGAKN
jgi:hypothetical protein